MVNELWTSTFSGALAGLGVAMPLGAIAALLLREGIVNGFRVSVAAAAGVATVDLFYCAGATAAGALLVRSIEEHRGMFLVTSGMLMILVGVMQLRPSLKKRSRPDADVDVDVEKTTPGAAFLRFVGLTAVNPMTLVYFVALGGAVGGRPVLIRLATPPGLSRLVLRESRRPPNSTLHRNRRVATGPHPGCCRYDQRSRRAYQFRRLNDPTGVAAS